MQPGSALGPYQIVEPLGAGGMGQVHLAEDTRLQRRVAVKLLKPEVLAGGLDPGALLHEARTAASLNHPNICTVHEVGESDGQAFIVMEYVEGHTLSEMIPAGGMSTDDVVRYGRQIAEALSHAHRHGVVHRDLKPANVRITSDGTAKVLDFGLALRLPSSELDRNAESRATVVTVGSTVGTLQYMAPEVFRGGTADHRSDIWSLGVVLYEMAAGHLPFPGEGVFDLSARILRDSPAPLPASVPTGLRTLIGRCLAKEPSRRQGRASEVAAALEMLETMLDAPAVGAGEAASAVPPTPQPSVEGPLRTHSLAVLPLTDLSGDPSQAYFADGMTEALITDLAKLGAVKVISRTSVMRYRNTSKPLPEIAEELGVDAIVEGSVLRAADRVRISAQLIHAATDSHLWADSYERDVSDVLALQRDVAQAIAREVGGSLRPTSEPRAGEDFAEAAGRPMRVGDPGGEPVTPQPTVDPIAYEAVLRARSYIEQQTAAGVRSASMWLERALDRDPDSSLAHSTLTMLRITEALYGEERPPREVMPQAIASARRALELDPHSAEAQLTSGMLAFLYDYEWETAERRFRGSLQANPNLAASHQFYGYFLAAAGRLDEAIEAATCAVDLDPLSPLAHADRSAFLVWAGRLDEATAAARRAVEVDPGRWRSHWALGTVLQARGALHEAVAAFREGMRVSDGGSLVQTWLAQALVAAGERDQAEALEKDLEERREAGYISAYLLAAVAASLGKRQEAFTLLEQGLEERTFYMVFLKVIAPFRFAAVQDDPRFLRLMEQANIP